MKRKRNFTRTAMWLMCFFLVLTGHVFAQTSTSSASGGSNVNCNPIGAAITVQQGTTCNDAALLVTWTHGNGPFVFSLYKQTRTAADIAGTSTPFMGFTASNPGSNPQGTPLTGVPIGSYWWHITDKYYPTCYGDSGIVVVTSANILPVPLAVAGLDRSLCNGSSTQLGTTAVTGDTYAWTSSPSGFTSTAANPTVSPTQTTTYTVTESNTGCSASHSVTVTVNPVSSITSATAGASPICSNATTTVTANGVAGTNVTLTWWTGTGGTGTNLGSSNPLTVGPGTYFARVTGDCGTAEASVTVGAKTNVSITSATAGASSICSSGTTTVTANGIAGTGAILTWWTGTGGTGTNLGSNNPLTVGPGTYFARVTGDCGAAEASVTVTSKTDVGVTSATSGASSVCPSATTTVTANGITGTNAVLTWWTATGGTGTNLGSNNPLTVGPGTYFARVTGDCGTAEASVTVASKTVVSITSATSGASPICPDATTTITANGISGTGASLTWYTGTGATGTNLGSNNPLTVGPGTYYAYVTGDCGTPAEASVTVGSKTVASITSATADASPICANATTNVTANGVAGTGSVLTWWTATGGTGTNLGHNNPLSVGPGTYFARVTGDCGTAEASVTVGSKTDVSITSATAGASPICTSATTTVTANGVSGTNAVLTWWTATGGTGTNLGSNNPLTVGPGTYFARVTGDCGTAEASVTVGAKTNVAITSATSGASPICSNATTTVTANGVSGTNAVITWWTATGGTGTNLGNNNPLTVGPGTYFARVTGDCGNPVEASVTVGAKTNVSITSATSGASPICSNATTTVTANGVAGTNAVLTWWTATGGTGTNLGSNNPLTVGPGTYFARVTGDCGNPVEASVTVGAKTNVSITSATSAASPICSNATTTVTANGVAGTNNVITWWTATGGTGTNLGHNNPLTVGPGTYFARVTGDCGNPVEASVTVGSKTNVSITSATSGASPICSNATTTVTANGVAGTGAVLTWWTATGGTGTNLGSNNPLTVGPGTYFARVTGDCGNPVEASVTVGSKTNVSITSATSGASPICSSATTTVTANGVAGTNAVITWWTATGGTGTNLGHNNPLTVGPGTYFARVTGDCGNPVEASVTVGSKTDVSITSATADASPICPDATTNVTANGVAGTGATLTWYTGTGATGTNLGSSNPLTVGPGTYYAYVTGDCGTPAEASVTVGAKTVAGITSATADATPICSSATTSVTANGVTGTGASLTWYTGPGATGTNLGSDNPMTVGPGTYYAFVTADCGTAEASVTVGSKTDVGITSVSSDASAVCPLATTTITANGITGTNAILTWYTGPGATGTNLGSDNPLTVGSGTYYAYVTGDCGTPAEASVFIDVNPVPAPSITTDVDPNICTGGSVTLTATDGTSWTWSPNGEHTQSITVSTAGDYSVTATNDAGCSATSSATTVTVTPLPDPGIITSGPTTFCQGGSVTLTASAGASYLWSTGDISQAITVSASGHYTVVVTNSNNCYTTSAVDVLVNQPPSVPTITPDGVCGPVTLTSSGNSADTYTWSNDIGPGLTTGNPITATTTGTYYVTETDANGCSSSTSLGVNVYETPVAGISSRTNWVNFNCYKYVALHGTSTVAGVTYSWSMNADGSSPFSTNQTVNVNPGNSTTHQSSYTYYLTVSNHGCISKTSIAITVSYDACIDCSNGGKDKSGTSAPHKVYFCQCGKPNVTICVDTNSIPAHINHGDHFGQCTSTNYSCTGGTLFETVEGNQVNIYPNPFTSIANIDLSFANAQNVSIDIMSLDGKVVKTIYNGMVEKDMPYHFQYDGSASKPGIYLVRVISGNEAEVRKIELFR
jgi:hypothetical protein